MQERAASIERQAGWQTATESSEKAR